MQGLRLALWTSQNNLTLGSYAWSRRPSAMNEATPGKSPSSACVRAARLEALRQAFRRSGLGSWGPPLPLGRLIYYRIVTLMLWDPGNMQLWRTNLAIVTLTSGLALRADVWASSA